MNGVPLDRAQIDRWVRDMKANDEAHARRQAEANAHHCWVCREAARELERNE